MQVGNTSSQLIAESIIGSSGVIGYNSNLTSLIRPLHVEGNKIKDDIGNIVYLRGVNKPRAIDHPSGCWGGWGHYKQSTVELVLSKMETYGINVIRYFFSAEWWINNPTVLTEEGNMTFREILDDLLTRCGNHKIYLILCTWTVVHGYHDSMAYPPYSQDSGSSLIPNANAFVTYMVEQITTLGSHENLIIEPWNEPFSAGGFWASTTTLVEWQSTWQNVITAIRAEETSKGYVNHLIIVQYASCLAYWGDMSYTWKNFNWLELYPLTDSAGNIVYSQHSYRPGGTVGVQELVDTRPYDYNTIKQIFIEEQVLYYSQIYPIIIGETGAKGTIGGEEEFLENSLTIWNEWKLGYIAWVWRDTGTIYDILQEGTESTTGGTVNSKGQIFVDTIATGEE
jgi:hypothetical protein